MTLRKLAGVLLLNCLPALAQPAVQDFSFVHITDMHLSPNLARVAEPPAVRGADCVAWICEQASRPQAVDTLGPPLPPPAFTVVTGDMTEYGVVDETWPQFEQVFAPLPGKLYVTPGNHDNTWVAMYEVMRNRHGGANYSFDHNGCHFICLCSASPQEPIPTLDATTRTWLARDLQATGRTTPIIVALHHPPNDRTMAQPAEYATLIDTLRDYNVVLFLYGHGHAVVHRQFCGIDGVMAGDTWEAPRAGYGVCAIRDGALHYAFRHYRAPDSPEGTGPHPAWNVLVNKPLPKAPPPRLIDLHIINDTPGGIPTAELRRRANAPCDIHLAVDGHAIETPTDGRFPIPTADLKPGWHILTATAKTPTGGCDIRAVPFRSAAPKRWQTARIKLPAAMKAAPVIVEDKVVVARTDGVIAAYEREALIAATRAEENSAIPRPAWTYDAGGEVLGTPTWTGDQLVFGAGDGRIHALDANGESSWTHAVGVPVYGWPVVADHTVYIGDNHGRLHALDVQTGAVRWTYARADYAIESWPCVWGKHVVFGAWDGYLYALHRESGKLAWKVAGPKSSAGRGVRYYAPADCGPVALDDTLFVCDRGYVLGRYGRNGQAGAHVATQVSAICPATGRKGLYARRHDDHVCRYDAAGALAWETSVPAGRFPIPPTCAGETVYVCSNDGLLSALDATDGAIRWQYQVTPGYYVLAPVTVDDTGICYVAAMDGTLSVICPPRSAGTSVTSAR